MKRLRYKDRDTSMKSIKLEHTPSPCTKINSKWLKHLTIRHDTIKLPVEITGKIF